MASFNPGDVLIDNVTISSPRSMSWNLASNLLTASITETIFTPGVTAELEVLDMQDYLGRLQLAGDESVDFSFTKPNGSTATYQFHLNNVKDVTVQGAMKSKVYKLICVSRETLTGQANHAQKGYNAQINNIISQLIQEFLNTSLPVITEETKGKIKHVVTNQPVFHAVENLRKQAVSAQNKSSNFMFYLTQKGIYFKTLEGMLQSGDIKNFKQDNTVGKSIFSDVDNNILAWKVIQNMDAFNRIKNGALTQTVATFNVHTNEYVKQDLRKDLSAFTNLGAGTLISQAFKNMFSKANKHALVYTQPNDKLNIGKTFFPETLPFKQLNLTQMQEQLMHMTVLGDPILEAGKTVFCTVPKITQDVYDLGAEPQMSGRWLISKLEHSIGRPDVRPRYTCNLECLKGAYQEGI